MTVVFVAAAASAWPPLFAAWHCRRRGLPARGQGFFAEWAQAAAVAAATSSAAAMVAGNWLVVAGFGASGLLGLILWWWSRRKRKRSLRLLGHKAKARLAAMARSMPRPSPRLVPQGSPA